MNSQVASCAGAGPSGIHSPHCASGRKRSAAGLSDGADGVSFELKGEKADCFEASVSVSSLKVRLAPAIQSTVAAAVDALLREVALVLSDALTETQRELVSRERENERLKLRLEVSEGELRALQECVGGAHRLVEQLPLKATPLAQAFLKPGGDRNPPQYFSQREGEEPAARRPADALPGFEEVKLGQPSIQADGTVTVPAVHRLLSPGHWGPISGPDECSAEIKKSSPEAGPEAEPAEQGIQPKFPIKQEPDQGLSQHGRVGAGEGPPVAPECEQTAQSVGELGRIHVVEEEGLSRALNCPLRLSNPSQPLFRSPSSTVSKTQTSTGVYQGVSVPPNGPVVANTTANSSERPHLCLECGKTFRLISSLKKHIRIHTGEKPYPCGVCGRHFRESGALKTHQRIHTGEKPYSCSDCGTSFRHLDGLRKHRRTHTGEKPYACVVCGKRLSRLQHLKHHQRIHTGERPCRCPRCHKSFKEPAALRKHLRTHREEPAGEDPAEACGEGPGPGPGGAEDFGRLQAPMLSPQLGFGMWGEDGEEGAAVNCIEER